MSYTWSLDVMYMIIGCHVHDHCDHVKGLLSLLEVIGCPSTALRDATVLAVREAYLVLYQDHVLESRYNQFIL